MLVLKRTFPCIEIFICTILINFSCTAFAEFDGNSDKSLETRLHNIYMNHYQKPVADSDWFKIVDAIEEQIYTVKGGDTLWGISKIYFGDGHYWSKLWSVNQSITNPHLILVSDKLHFKAGSFQSAPSITVEQGAGVEAKPLADGAISSPEDIPVARLSSSDLEANLLPPSFQNRPKFQISPVIRVSIEERPTLHLQTKVKMTQEVLNDSPELMGTVRSVGEYRINTGEGNRVILERRYKPLQEGSLLTILDPNFSGAKSSFWVKVRAIVRVVKAIDANFFEAQVIEQFDSILTGSQVSTYQVQTVEIDSPTDQEPITARVSVMDNAERTFWSEGDFIFMKAKDNIAVGDLVNINNRFSKNVKFYTNSGVVKIVSVSPPYATGVVMYSRAPIDADSLSRR